MASLRARARACRYPSYDFNSTPAALKRFALFTSVAIYRDSISHKT